MSQQSASQQPRPKIGQFSRAEMLVAISLVGVTCGAFRFDIGLGIGVLHLTIAIAIAAIRAQAAVCNQEEFWNEIDCPDEVRRSEAFRLGKTSFRVAVAALFIFHVGFWIAAILECIAIFFLQGLLSLYTVWFLVMFVFGAGIISAAWWLKSTWPRSYFTEGQASSSPLDKTI